MREIARQMREAQQRIAKADSGPGTQQLQRQIVDDLDRLIQQARKSAGQCQSGAVPIAAQLAQHLDRLAAPTARHAQTSQQPNDNPPDNHFAASARQATRLASPTPPPRKPS